VALVDDALDALIALAWCPPSPVILEGAVEMTAELVVDAAWECEHAGRFPEFPIPWDSELAAVFVSALWRFLEPEMATLFVRSVVGAEEGLFAILRDYADLSVA
jgi:hypothetical protein